MPTNCPYILQGYSKGCRDAQGGVQKFYITEHQNIASYTEASGVLTAITMNVGKRFYLYEQELNTANYTETITHNRQAGTTFSDQTFNATLLKRSASVSYALRAIAHQDVAIIAVDQTGTAFILGIRNGMALDASPSTSGTAAGDANKYDLVFKGQEPILAPTISDALITQVTT